MFDVHSVSDNGVVPGQGGKAGVGGGTEGTRFVARGFTGVTFSVRF